MTTYSRKDLARDLREGPYTSLGGYPKFFVSRDGCTLSFKTVLEHAKLCLRATGQAKPALEDLQWAIYGADINWEDPDLYCEHSGERIPSAYAEPEAV